RRRRADDALDQVALVLAGPRWAEVLADPRCDDRDAFARHAVEAHQVLLDDPGDDDNRIGTAGAVGEVPVARPVAELPRRDGVLALEDAPVLDDAASPEADGERVRREEEVGPTGEPRHRHALPPQPGATARQHVQAEARVVRHVVDRRRRVQLDPLERQLVLSRPGAQQVLVGAADPGPLADEPAHVDAQHHAAEPTQRKTVSDPEARATRPSGTVAVTTSA